VLGGIGEDNARSGRLEVDLFGMSRR